MQTLFGIFKILLSILVFITVALLTYMYYQATHFRHDLLTYFGLLAILLAYGSYALYSGMTEYKRTPVIKPIIWLGIAFGFASTLANFFTGDMRMNSLIACIVTLLVAVQDLIRMIKKPVVDNTDLEHEPLDRW